MKQLTDALSILRSAEILSEETLSGVEQTFSSLEKTASKGKAFFEHLGIPLIGALGVSAFSGGMGYLLAKKRFGNHNERLKTSFDAVLGEPQLAQNSERAKQLFSELSLISPTVAGNPRIAAKLIQNRLQDGFNLNDVHKLSAIEYHASNTSHPEEPFTAAKITAARSFTDQVGRILPSGLRGVATELDRQETARISKERADKAARQEAHKRQQQEAGQKQRDEIMKNFFEEARRRKELKQTAGGAPQNNPGSPGNPADPNKGDTK